MRNPLPHPGPERARLHEAAPPLNTLQRSGQALDQHDGAFLRVAGGTGTGEGGGVTSEVGGVGVGGGTVPGEAGGDLSDRLRQPGDVEVLEDGDAVEEGKSCCGGVVRVCDEQGVNLGGCRRVWWRDDVDGGVGVRFGRGGGGRGGGGGGRGEVRGDEVGGEVWC